MATAHVNPVMLRWAAARADVNPEALSKSLKQKVPTVESWLEGSASPTFVQAQKLAKRLRVPFGYLFVSEPPADDLPLPDFRRRPAGATLKPSVDLLDVIADVQRHQDWYRDFRLGNDEQPLPFVGRFDAQTPVDEVAADIRQNLDFDSKVRVAQPRDDFLRAFVRQVEGLGVLVMRNGVVGQATNRPLSVDEFRGFSITDPMAPVIFINNADSPTAQNFTLAHELAHIWIGQSGISDAEPTIPDRDFQNIEAYCNAVAGEVLLPWDRLAHLCDEPNLGESEWLKKVAKEFCVSTAMVARQLWSHDAISRERFFQIYEEEKSKWTKQRESKSSGGNYYRTVPIRNSLRFTEAILESVAASETLIRDASRLLGVKPANLPKLRASLGALSALPA